MISAPLAVKTIFPITDPSSRSSDHRLPQSPYSIGPLSASRRKVKRLASRQGAEARRGAAPSVAERLWRTGGFKAQHQSLPPRGPESIRRSVSICVIVSSLRSSSVVSSILGSGSVFVPPRRDKQKTSKSKSEPCNRIHPWISPGHQPCPIYRSALTNILVQTLAVPSSLRYAATSKKTKPVRTSAFDCKGWCGHGHFVLSSHAFLGAARWAVSSP